MNQKLHIGQPGDFNRSTLVGHFQPSADQIWSNEPHFGLNRDGFYVYGEFFDEDGTRYLVVRKIEGNFTTYVFSVHSNEDRVATRLDKRAVGKSFTGALTRSRDENSVTFDANRHHTEASAKKLSPFSPNRLSLTIGPDGAHWVEQGLVDIRATMVGPGLQWFTPYSGGGIFVLSMGHRAEGTVNGKPVKGFFFFDQFYTVQGVSWPYDPVVGGQVIRWNTFANWFEDGTVELGHFAFGQGKWGFALVNDSTRGPVHARADLTSQVLKRDEIDYMPRRIETFIGDEKWLWTADPDGDMPDFLRPHSPNTTGAERREGETRKVLYAMGWGESWPDAGRERR
jgi:hypothetical protein